MCNFLMVKDSMYIVHDSVQSKSSSGLVRYEVLCPAWLVAGLQGVPCSKKPWLNKKHLWHQPWRCEDHGKSTNNKYVANADVFIFSFWRNSCTYPFQPHLSIEMY